VIDTAKDDRCSKNEIALDWSQRGPKSDMGATEPQGPKGNDGLVDE
jgi:hypothetical protein